MLVTVVHFSLRAVGLTVPVSTTSRSPRFRRPSFLQEARRVSSPTRQPNNKLTGLEIVTTALTRADIEYLTRTLGRNLWGRTDLLS